MGIQSIDDYRVLALLGEGGMGSVYRVRSPEGTELALKLLRPGTRMSELSALRFRREFELASRLQHPNLVGVHELGEFDQAPYYTMDLVPGRPFTDHLEEARNQKQRDEYLGVLGRVGAQLLTALAYIHRRDIVHRDLKPENVLVDQNERLRLLDFGMALIQTEARITRSGTVMGTFQYISPEQLGTGEVDARTDLYSLGVILYEHMSGALPFQGRDLYARIRHILFTDPSPVGDLAPEYPPPLQQIVDRLIRREPSERFSDALEVLEAWATAFQPYTEPLAPQATAPAAPNRLFEPRLVGRTRDQEAAVNVLKQTESGRGSLLMVSGPSGIGKSRFMREIRAHAMGRGLAHCWGSAQEGESPPYALWRPALEKALGDGLPPEMEPFRAALGRVLPQLAEDTADSPETEPGDPTWKYQLFEGMCRLLKHLARKSRTLVVLLEDVHWADGASLEFLGYLGQRMLPSGEPADQSPLLVAISWRQEEYQDNPQLVRVVDSLNSEARAQSLELGPLSLEDTEAMVRSMLGAGSLEGPALERIYRETEGNPLLVGELLKAWLTGGELCRRESGWSLKGSQELSLPRTILETLSRRLDGLDAESISVLRVAAVLGRTFHFDVLSKVLDLPFTDLLDRLEPCLARRVLVEGGPGSNSLAFYHSGLREALLGSTPEALRRELHGRAATALEQLYSPEEVAFVLAHHFKRCGQPEKASVHLWRAGEESVRSFAYPRAVECFQEVLALPEDCWPVPRSTLQESLADAQHGSGSPRAGLELYTAMLGEEIEGPVVKARLLRKAGACFDELGDYSRAEQCLKEGLNALGVDPLPAGMSGTARITGKLLAALVPTLGTLAYPQDPELAKEIRALCHHLVHVQFFLRRPGWMSEAFDFTLHQLLAAMACGDYEASPQSRFTLGHVFLRGPRVLRSVAPQLLKQAAARAGDLEEPLRATMLRQSGYLLHEAGHSSLAAELTHQAEEISQRIGDMPGLAETFLILCTLYGYWGFLQRAESYAQKAMETARACELRTVQVLIKSDLANICCLAGRTAEARQWVDQLRADQRERRSPFIEMVTELVDGQTLLLEGQPERALQKSRTTREKCEELGGGPFYLVQLLALEAASLLACARADEEHRAERLERAREVLDRTEGEAHGMTRFEGLSRRLRGDLERDAGHAEPAAGHYRAALSKFETLGSPLEQARTHEALAEVTGEAGHLEKAAVLLGEAGLPAVEVPHSSFDKIKEGAPEGAGGDQSGPENR